MKRRRATEEGQSVAVGLREIRADERMLDASFREQSPAAIRAAIQSFVRSTPALAWAEDAPALAPQRWP